MPVRPTAAAAGDGVTGRQSLHEAGELPDDAVRVDREPEELGQLAHQDRHGQAVHVADHGRLRQQLGDEAQPARPATVMIAATMIASSEASATARCGIPVGGDQRRNGRRDHRPERGVRIHVFQYYGHYNDLVAQLVANEIDVAVTPAGTHEISADLVFEPLIAARNVVACSTQHPLLAKATLSREDFLRFAWVAPLPGSPLMLDLTNILMTLGIGELAIRYSGGSLVWVVNYLAASQTLAIMPLSVVYSLPPELQITALPLDIPQPERMIGVIYRRFSANDPVNRKFFGHLHANMKNLSRIVAKRDAAATWRRGPFWQHAPGG